MKNANKLILAAGILTAACTKESSIEILSASGDTVRLTASFETGTTRTSLGNGLAGAWTVGDHIAVYDGSAIRDFALCGCSGPTATFEGEMDTSAKTFYAAYPYSAVTACSNGYWTLSVPSTQTVAAGDSVAVGALAAVARFTDPGTVSFKNVTGLLRMEIPSEGIASVTLTGNQGEYLAGKVKVDAASGSVSGSPNGTSVTLEASSGTLPKGAYYLAVLPATLSSGLTLTLTDSNGNTAIKTGSNALTVLRNGSLNLGDVTSGLSWSNTDLVIDSDDSDASDEDIVANTTFDRRVKVTYASSGAVVTGGDGLTVKVSGNDVTITNGTDEKVIYELSGTASDGFFKLYSSKKQAIVLNGLSLTNKNGAAINNQSHKRTFVVVEGTNTLADGSSYTDTPSDEDEKAAFFSEGQLIFSGSGTLTVTAGGKAGITSDDYVRFMSSPTVKVTSSAGHGIRGKEAVIVSNGAVEAQVSADMKKGFSSDSLVRFSGGTTTVKMTGSAGYDSEDKDYTGVAGVRADQRFEMMGGSLKVTSSGKGGKGISCDGSGLFSGGTITITASGSNYAYSGDTICSKGLRCEGAIDWTGTTARVTSYYSEGIEAKGVITISGGEIYSYAKDDAINAASTLTISGGKIYAQATGNDAIDANGNFYVKGGIVVAIGATSPELALDANTEGGYKLYIQGGTLVTIGGLEKGATLSQKCYSANSWNKSTWYGLYSGNSLVLAFKTPSSGGSPMIVSYSSTPTLKSDITVSGGTSLFNGLAYTGATSSGGKAVSLSNYSSGSW